MRIIDGDLLKKDLESSLDQHKNSTFDMYERGATNAYRNALDLLDEQPEIPGDSIFEANRNGIFIGDIDITKQAVIAVVDYMSCYISDKHTGVVFKFDLSDGGSVNLTLKVMPPEEEEQDE